MSLNTKTRASKIHLHVMAKNVPLGCVVSTATREAEGSDLRLRAWEGNQLLEGQTPTGR